MKSRVTLDEALKDRIVEMYVVEGIAFQTIGKTIHIWPPRVRQVLIERGITILPRRTSQAKEDAIAKDYTSGGLTIAHITDKHGITDKVVWRIIKERNLVRETPAIPRARTDKGIPFYDRWLARYGKEEADRRKTQHRKRSQYHSKGSNNPMYGKPSPQGSGNGWKGWYKNIFFRSLRELAFMLEMEDRKVQWINGEKKEYRVKYVDPQGAERTYAPDYIVPGEAMYEIKPKRLWDSPLVTAKRLAAEVLCKQMGIKYVLVDPVLDGERLMAVYKAGSIKWWGKCEEKFLRYYEVEV